MESPVAQQQKVILDAEHVADQYRQIWIQAKQRMDILEQTISNFREEELRHEHKQDQLLADELSRNNQHNH